MRFMCEEVIQMTGFGESSYRRNPAQDPRELERLVLTYADQLVRYAYSIVGSSAAAEDVMEDTFALLLAKGGHFADEAAIRAWLYKVAHNQAILYLRRHKKEVPLQDVEQVLHGDFPEADLLRRERNEILYLCLQKLPGDYRQALQLRYLEGFTPAQIASITGHSTKRVYNLLQRGRVTLRDYLMKEGISCEDI